MSPLSVPPIVIDDNGDVRISPSISTACLRMEPVDVLDGVFQGFDSLGRHLILDIREDAIVMANGPARHGGPGTTTPALRNVHASRTYSAASGSHRLEHSPAGRPDRGAASVPEGSRLMPGVLTGSFGGSRW